MTTYADKKDRLFYTKDNDLTSRLRRKRSNGRLKAFSSSTDQRSWSLSPDDRRQYMLQVLNSYETSLGNYIPFDELLRILVDLKDSERNEILNAAVNSFEKLDEILEENEGLERRLNSALQEKDELDSLADCLEKAKGDLKKENECLKNEIDRIKDELKDKLSELEKENSDLKNEIDNLRAQKLGEGDTVKVETTDEEIQTVIEDFSESEDKPFDGFAESNEADEVLTDKTEDKESVDQKKSSDIEEDENLTTRMREDDETEKEEVEDALGSEERFDVAVDDKLEDKQKYVEAVKDELGDKQAAGKKSDKKKGKKVKKTEKEKPKDEGEEEDRDSLLKDTVSSQEKQLAECKNEIDFLSQERDNLRKEVERLKKAEKDLLKAESRIHQLLDEMELLQSYIHKQNKENCILVEELQCKQGELQQCKIIDCKLREQLRDTCQQRNHFISIAEKLKVELNNFEKCKSDIICKLEKLKEENSCLVQELNKLKIGECQKHEMEEEQNRLINENQCLLEELNQLKSGDCKKYQLEDKCNRLVDQNHCLVEELNKLKSGDCGRNELEEKCNRLVDQIHQMAQLCQTQEFEKIQLDKKITQQQECINSLQEILVCLDIDINTTGHSQTESRDNSCKETEILTPCQDLNDLQHRMKELQSKVCQQASLIMSQRKCLLEQHRYILDQEDIRSNMQKRIREQSRKQAELTYERNVLSSEVKFLTNRLKSYLEKIEVLEKSVEKFFGSQKRKSTRSRNCNYRSPSPPESQQLFPLTPPLSNPSTCNPLCETNMKTNAKLVEQCSNQRKVDNFNTQKPYCYDEMKPVCCDNQSKGSIATSGNLTQPSTVSSLNKSNLSFDNKCSRYTSTCSSDTTRYHTMTKNTSSTEKNTSLTCDTNSDKQRYNRNTRLAQAFWSDSTGFQEIPEYVSPTSESPKFSKVTRHIKKSSKGTQRNSCVFYDKPEKQETILSNKPRAINATERCNKHLATSHSKLPKTKCCGSNQKTRLQ